MMLSAIIAAWLAHRRKWLVTLVTFLAGLISLGLVQGRALWVCMVLVLALNSAGVHRVRNAPPPDFEVRRRSPLEWPHG